MATDFFKVKKGLNVEPKTGSTVTVAGDVAYNNSTGQLEVYTSAAESLSTASNTQTLTNKSIDAGTNTLSNIANASISASAAIAYSKLNLAGSIVNADISASAAIAYSKLNLSASIVNADVATGAAIDRTKLASGSNNHVIINDGSGVLSSEANLAISRGGTGAGTKSAAFDALSPMTTSGDIIYGGASGTGTRLAKGSDGQVLTLASGIPSWATSSSAPTAPYQMWNLGIASSVGANALTINLKQADGTTDPSSGTAAVQIGFRSATATSGAYNVRSVTSSLSLTVASGATLGTANGVATYLWVYALDNAGTVELAISQTLFDCGGLVSTTALSGSSNSNAVLYSTTARSNVPIRLIGRLNISEATAGTWASNATEVSIKTFDVTGIKVIACYTSTDGGTPSSSRLNYNNKIKDTHNAVSTGSGTWTFTTPKTATYDISAGFYAAPSAGQKTIIIKRAGTQIAQAYTNNTSTFAQTIVAAITIDLTVGDVITVETDWSAALQTAAGLNVFKIFEI